MKGSDGRNRLRHIVHPNPPCCRVTEILFVYPAAFCIDIISEPWNLTGFSSNQTLLMKVGSRLLPTMKGLVIYICR